MENTESVRDLELPKDIRRANREANIELVRKLHIRGVTSTREIQAYFLRQDPPIRVKNRTIERYKGIVKMRNAKRLVKSEQLWKTVEELALELRDGYRELTKEAWIIVHSKHSTPGERIKAMALIKEISENWIKRLQSLGLVHEEPTKIQAIGADGLPVDPQSQVEVNIESLNTEFVSFIKAKYQDPVGTTNDFNNLSRKQVLDAVAIPQSAEQIRAN